MKGDRLKDKISMLHGELEHVMGGMDAAALRPNSGVITVKEHLAARVLFRAIKKHIIIRRMNARRGSSLAGPPGSPMMTHEEWSATMGSTGSYGRNVQTSEASCQTDAGANALAVIDKVERLGLSGVRQLPFLPQIGSSPISPMGMSMSMSAAQRSPGASVSRSPGASVSRATSPQVGDLKDEDDSLL